MKNTFAAKSFRAKAFSSLSLAGQIYPALVTNYVAPQLTVYRLGVELLTLARMEVGIESIGRDLLVGTLDRKNLVEWLRRLNVETIKGERVNVAQLEVGNG